MENLGKEKVNEVRMWLTGRAQSSDLQRQSTTGMQMKTVLRGRGVGDDAPWVRQPSPAIQEGEGEGEGEGAGAVGRQTPQRRPSWVQEPPGHWAASVGKTPRLRVRKKKADKKLPPLLQLLLFEIFPSLTYFVAKWNLCDRSLQ